MKIKKDGWFLPAWIVKDRVLTATEKLVLSVIVNLHEAGGCKCSNRYIAEQVGISTGAAKQCIMRLRVKGALADNAMKFPQSFIGKRLVPILSGVQKHTIEVTDCYGEVTKPTTYTNTIRTDTEEESAAQKYPSDSECLEIENCLSSNLPGRGFGRERSRLRLEQAIRERKVSRSSKRIGDWVAYLAKIMHREDAAAARKAKAVPPAVVHQSQFGTSH